MKHPTLTPFINTMALPLSVLLLLGIGTLLAFGQRQGNRAPVVSNAHAEQRSGTHLVDITYDVKDPDGDTMTVSVEVSNDGGKTFNVPAKTFSGDIGPGITSGVGKRIVWNAGTDAPNTSGSNYMATITADDGVMETPPDEMISEVDGARMRLIPAGEFQMGSANGENDEKPVHTVYLDAFYIDVYEVTNAQYQKFVDAMGHPAPSYWNDAKYNAPDQPVVGVTWYDAAAYCQWAGKRLPTEAEWEKAARGGLVSKKYPWGDSIDSGKANYNSNVGKTTPVGKYPPNGYSLYDMAGNVWEWCLGEYQGDFYQKSPKNNPFAGGNILDVINNFTNVKAGGVVRGGSWYFVPSGVRVAYRGRGDPDFWDVLLGGVGFRCVSPRVPR